MKSSVIKTAVENVRDIVCLPDVDQTKGIWQDDGKCCVGARLAHALNEKSGDFLKGIDAFAKTIGGNRAHVILMLREAGRS